MNEDKINKINEINKDISNINNEINDINDLETYLNNKINKKKKYIKMNIIIAFILPLIASIIASGISNGFSIFNISFDNFIIIYLMSFMWSAIIEGFFIIKDIKDIYEYKEDNKNLYRKTLLLERNRSELENEIKELDEIDDNNIIYIMNDKTKEPMKLKIRTLKKTLTQE